METRTPRKTWGAAPSQLSVSLAAIQANAALMLDTCRTPVMAVVKADGFGMGAVRAARAALAGGASELGVATCSEAIELRRAGITAPILAWVLHEDAPVAEALSCGIRLAPSTPAQIRHIAALAAQLGSIAELELEVETGMHRSGCPPEQWDELFRAAADAADAVRVVGLWTHLAGSVPEHFDEPLARLADAAALARRSGLRPRLHAAASVAATVDPRTRLDLVRLGASVFGIEPVRDRPLGLTAVARWETRVTQVRDVVAGDVVGYDRVMLDHPSRLALLPVGYADGIPRHAALADGRVMTVMLGGRRFPIVGAVSMDQTVIDVGDLPVERGDLVTIIGDPRQGEPALAEWAQMLHTIPQEVLTGIGSRVARGEVYA